jgi:cation diffusion facilitator CzcD-associated flavoprotein CzcO
MPGSVSVTIVGAGFGGVAAAIALGRQGIDDVVLLERGDDVGGVWRANTYPGLACDVPSHLYSFSFAPNPSWSRRFSPGPEIHAYLRAVVDRFGVAGKIRFGEEVTRADFDSDTATWRITTASGASYRSDMLVAACGQLNRPQIPVLPGIDSFAGASFHSAEWDHSVPLDGVRVASIGTGASAIQYVPEIAPVAATTTVYQRSAPWIVAKADAKYSARKQELYRRRPVLQRLARELRARTYEALIPVSALTPPRRARAGEALIKLLAAINRTLALRGDPRLMRATRPTDSVGCKRLLQSSDWYPTLRRPDVELVTEPIAQVVPEGVVTDDGTLRPADVMIFGTGFKATEFLAPIEITGRDGVMLADAWAQGAEAFLGMAVPGFPNMFVLYGPNTNFGFGSILSMHEAQAAYIASAAALLSDDGARVLEVRPEVNAAFQAELAGRLGHSAWATGCSNWYRVASGRVVNNWPGTQAEYNRRTRRLERGHYLTEVPQPSRTSVAV